MFQVENTADGYIVSFYHDFHIKMLEKKFDKAVKYIRISFTKFIKQ